MVFDFIIDEDNKETMNDMAMDVDDFLCDSCDEIGF